MAIESLVGCRFGRLVVDEFAGIRNRHYYWRCQCDCGQKTMVDAGKLRSGHTQSCGCLLNERRVESHTTHGHAKQGARSAEYGIWVSMRQRCNSESSSSYGRYGARGVKVCSRWGSFSVFLEDMGPRPSALHSIERINVNGDYEPSNCKWIESRLQARNRRESVIVNYRNSQTQLSGLCESKGLNYHAVWQRLHRLGWTVERAIDTPIREKTRGNTTLPVQ